MTGEAPQPAERWTLWVKRTDVDGARYDLIKHVDPGQLVAELIARWVSDKKLDVDPSLVTLRLVTCAPGDDPSEAQEQAATELSPRRTLREAGVADGSSLLACFAAARRSGSGSPVDAYELLRPLLSDALDPKQLRAFRHEAAFQKERSMLQAGDLERRDVPRLLMRLQNFVLT